MTARSYLPAGEDSANVIYDRPPKTPRILVVEDEPILRRLNAQALLRKGYNIDTALDGQAGWEALQARQYDLLLTDHRMPRMMGSDLIKLLRFHELKLPVILTTADCPEELQNQLGTLHIDVVLSKPYTLQELEGAVNNI